MPIALIVATFAITACGSSTKKAFDAGDSGETFPDVGAKTDLHVDSNPASKDDSADVTAVIADTGPDTPVLGLDGTSTNDAGPDTAVLGRDGMVPDATIFANDAGPDMPVLGPDGAAPDTTDSTTDAGPDNIIVQKDTARDGVVRDVVADIAGPAACTGTERS